MRMTTAKSELTRVLRSVRRRWRMRHALRGGALVVALSALALVLSGWALPAFRFDPGAVLTFRIASYLLIGVVALRYLVWPLIRPVDDARVALYLEEHEPGLESAILAAVEAVESGRTGVRRSAGGAPGGRAPRTLEDGLLESALRRAREIDDGRRIDGPALWRWSGALAASAVVTVGLLLLLPGAARQGAAALLFPNRTAEELTPFAIQVEPGDVTVARGSDQSIRARLVNFQAGEVDLLIRGEGDAEPRRLGMLPDEEGDWELLLLDLDTETEYWIESSGVRSPVHRIAVEDLPFVDRLRVEYLFPDYTGLAPRVEEDGGDVAALRGTRVRLTVHPTFATEAGTLVQYGDSVALSAGGDGTLLGEFTVGDDGFYNVLLRSPRSALIEASPEFAIDALDDQPPSVGFETPGRDTRATSIEEVYLEARADDDFGVRSLDLVYTVNGTRTDTISLVGGGSLREVSAGHTLFLEEWDLEPGDLVSYHAVARDGSPDADPVTSDIYFLQVRPFDQEFRAADQQGPPMGGGGEAAGLGGSLSGLQREVVAATFNLERDRDRYAAAEFSESVTSVRLAQARVEGEVRELVGQIVQRGVAGGDPAFQTVLDELPRAADVMLEALESLEAEAVADALPPEQRALQHLLRAEAAFDQVQVGRQQGGGGGGQAGAEELADLFELEMDQLQNQYETLQRGERRQTSEQVDETLERLRELARRQQQQVERQRRLAGQPGTGQGWSGNDQRALADEAEEAARELERLARESGSRELQDAARRLREAAESMRRSAASRGNQGSAQAEEALRGLEEATRRLENDRSQRLESDTRDALRRAREMAAEQERIRQDLDELGVRPGETERVARLREQKSRMADRIEQLERQLDRMAADVQGEDRDAAQRLREAAGGIRDDKLKEKVRYSRGMVGTRADDYARDFEADIQENLESLTGRLEAASAAVGGNDRDAASEALDETRDLVRGVESMGERLRRPAQGDPEAQRADEAGREAGGQQGTEGPTGGPAGGFSPGGGAAGAGEGGRALSADEIRQFRREAGQRRTEIDRLRQGLEGSGREAPELDEAARALRALEQAGDWDDTQQILRLQADALRSLQRLEFRLRREVEGDPDARGVRAGSGNVPERFRELVDEYFRSLSEEAGGG